MSVCWYPAAHAFRRAKEQRLLPAARPAVSDLSLNIELDQWCEQGPDTTFPTSLWRKALCLLPLSPSLSRVPPG